MYDAFYTPFEHENALKIVLNSIIAIGPVMSMSGIAAASSGYSVSRAAMRDGVVLSFGVFVQGRKDTFQIMEQDVDEKATRADRLNAITAERERAVKILGEFHRAVIFIP